MTIKAAKSQKSVHKVHKMLDRKPRDASIHGEDVVGWEISKEELQAFQNDSRNKNLIRIIRPAIESGRKFFGPEACSAIVFLTAEALDGLDEKDSMWNMYDAILAGAFNGWANMTGMEIVA